MDNSQQSAYPTLTYDSFTGGPNGQLLGMTKLEHLAGLAMQAILSNPDEANLTLSHILEHLELPKDTKYHSSYYTKYVAKRAVMSAKALLKELELNPEPEQ